MTLTGPAGAGKTRLAIEVAGRNPGPVCYVDFSPIDDPGLVAATVAAAAGVTIKPGDEPVDAITDTLASRDLLLVLDTCEHVVAAVAQLVSAILGAAAGVRVLATSRRALGIPGEFAWPVPPLDVPPPDATTAEEITSHAAVALFVERATSVWPDLAIDDAVAADIAAVCVALDGLPLAIELAAARADVLSPAAIRSRLQDRFGLLVDGGVAVAERQQTLRAAIDWSFELPVSRSANVLRSARRLRRHVRPRRRARASPVTARRAARAAGLAGQAVDGRPRRQRPIPAARHVAGLRTRRPRRPRRRRDPQPPRRLLRAAGRGRRARDPRPRPAGPSRPCSAATSTTSGPRSNGPVHRRHDQRRPPGRAHWRGSGRSTACSTEAIQHLERLIEIDDVPPPTRAKCLWGYALLASSLGRLETARAAAYQAVRLAGPSDTAGTAYGLNAAAVAEWALGNHDRSLDAHRQAIALLDQLDDPWGLAVCHVLQARTLFDLGDDTAAAVARIGVEHARRAGDRHVFGIALTQIAQIAIAGHDAAAAISAASEALALQERIGYTEGIVSALHVLGHAHRASATRRGAAAATDAPSASPPASDMPPRCAKPSRTSPATSSRSARPSQPRCCGRHAPSGHVASCPSVSATPSSSPQLEQALTALGEHGSDDRSFR